MLRKIKLFIKQQKLSRLNKTGRIFMPSLGKRFIVVPFKWLSLIPIILLTGASIFLLLRSDIFLAKNLTIRQDESISGDTDYTDGLLSEPEIRVLIDGEVIARSLWAVDTEKIKNTISEFGQEIVKSVEVNRAYPDSIEVVIDERKPIALLIPEVTEVKPDGDVISKKEYYLIDDEGFVFMKVKRNVGLPEFHYPTLFNNLTNETSLIGFSIDTDLVYSTITLIDLLKNIQYVTPTKIEVEDAYSIKIYTEKGEAFTLALHDDLKKQVEKITVVYEQSLYTGKNVKTIDTRFEKTVVTYSN